MTDKPNWTIYTGLILVIGVSIGVIIKSLSGWEMYLSMIILMIVGTYINSQLIKEITKFKEGGKNGS